MSDEPKDTNEIRQRLLRIACGSSWDIDRPERISAAVVIVRNAMRAADHAGLSGEDRYALMTWHLLQHATRMEKMVLTDLMLTPARLIAMPQGEQG